MEKKVKNTTSTGKPSLDSKIWTRLLFWLIASFCAKVLFRDGPDQGHGHVCQCGNLKKNTKKRQITKSTTTPTHNAFRQSEFHTVARSARRIFLCKVVVQGRSR